MRTLEDTMRKKILFLGVLFGAFFLAGCKDKTTAKPTTSDDTTTTTAEPSLSYNFVIYEPDSNNTDLSDNTVVATYTITYYASSATYVTDSLIKGSDNKYYFVEGGTDYLVLTDSGYGLSYTQGYFKDYAACAENTAIDVSWSLTTVNGEVASKGIGETKLKGLTTYGFVIDGWKVK